MKRDCVHMADPQLSDSQRVLGSEGNAPWGLQPSGAMLLGKRQTDPEAMV